MSYTSLYLVPAFRVVEVHLKCVWSTIAKLINSALLGVSSEYMTVGVKELEATCQGLYFNTVQFCLLLELW